MKSFAIWAAAAVTLVVSPVAAQQHEHHAPPAQPTAHGGMEHCHGVAGPLPTEVLGHREHLALSPAQVATLEDLSRTADAAMPKMHEAMQTGGELTKLLSAPNPDIAEYERRLRANGEQMVQAHVALASVAVRTRALLTPEQQKQFQAMSPAGSKRTCPLMNKPAQPATGGMTHKH